MYFIYFLKDYCLLLLGPFSQQFLLADIMFSDFSLTLGLSSFLIIFELCKKLELFYGRETPRLMRSLLCNSAVYGSA